MSTPRFYEFRVAPAQAGLRLDQALGAQEGCTRGQARRLIAAGAVFVDGRRTLKASRPVQAGERVRAPRALPDLPVVDIGSRVLHRDAQILVLDKPAGVPAAPTPLGVRGSLGALAADQLGLDRLPRVVHRLDRDASGVMALALDRSGARRLDGWFSGGLACKWYRAVVTGRPDAPEGEVTLPIGRDPARRGRMRVHPRGDPARTGYRVLPEAAPPGCSVVEVRLHTGRTHQIRVHLASLGCPVLGDRWYGGARRITGPDGRPGPATRLWLHAERMEVASEGPSGDDLVLVAPLPEGWPGARG